MTTSKFRLSFLCALVCAGLAVVFMSCAPMGTMNGTVGMNIGDQPVWGPTGYDQVEYYSIPDIDSYYSVSEHQYIYRNGSTWEHSASLPSRYNTYDPYHSYKVVINEDKPYHNNAIHQSQYGQFKSVKDQPVIRDSHDKKYFVNKDHPEHAQWAKEQKH